MTRAVCGRGVKGRRVGPGVDAAGIGKFLEGVA